MMTTEPNTAAQTTGDDLAETPAPATAYGAAPAANTTSHVALEEITVTVRRAAADALQQVSETVAYGTDPHGQLAAITEQATAAALANGLPDGSWDQGRVEGVALVALLAATVTTGEASAALGMRLRDLDADELARRLASAAFFVRP